MKKHPTSTFSIQFKRFCLTDYLGGTLFLKFHMGLMMILHHKKKQAERLFPLRSIQVLNIQVVGEW
ncbi:MAG TPA: hypothetical protein DD706_19505 [Nitrospiraceae bacterium]|nr:hypothetical protein [Nitrospiraceae bacterium]